MTSVLCCGQMMLPSLLISCFASCQHSVVMSVPVLGSTDCYSSVCSVSPSHVSTFYICITISSHNHTAAAAGHGKHSYLCQDTWDVIHRTGSQKALLHRICTPASVVIVLIRDPWAGHIIHILLRSLHWIHQRTMMCSRLGAQCAASAPCCD